MIYFTAFIITLGRKKMKYLAQIHWDTIEECAEGTLYIEICPDCRMITMFHQQT